MRASQITQDIWIVWKGWPPNAAMMSSALRVILRHSGGNGFYGGLFERPQHPPSCVDFLCGVSYFSVLKSPDWGCSRFGGDHQKKRIFNPVT